MIRCARCIYVLVDLHLGLYHIHVRGRCSKVGCTPGGVAISVDLARIFTSIV